MWEFLCSDIQRIKRICSVGAVFEQEVQQKFGLPGFENMLKKETLKDFAY